ncbi:MAG: TonB-dependent receptor [Polaribacter sp.]|uniref:TonB-dependent receptor n=1 Tax=Polaribacter sp. TaxID=1920175 RepID=UPI003267AA47
MKKVLTIIIVVLMSSFTFSQEKIIKGKVTDENNTPLPGVSIFVKGTTDGAVSDMDGEYRIEVKKDNAVIVFSYLGYKTIEHTVGDKSIVNIKMEVDAQSLTEIVITTGIRSSQAAAIEAKRDAAVVIEAITPEDIGNFSDNNVADALQRIAGVQIERDVDDVSGDRVSIRGIGPQFVQVTMNGRSPISAGNEGKSDFRKFNLNVIPSEIISGARIHKTTQAKEVATAIGGTVDFLTIKPLEMRYKRGKNYVASAQVRTQQNSELNELDPAKFTGRASGVYVTKISEKLGFAISAIYANEDKQKDETSFRTFDFVNFKEDTNGNGAFDEGVDKTYDNLLIAKTINNTLIRSNEERLAGSVAIQFQPTEELDFVFDYTRTNVESNSSRQAFQLSLGAGGAKGLFGGDHLFDVGDILLDDRDNLLYISPSNNVDTRTTISNKAQFFDNYTTNNILGLRTKYTPSEKFNILFDVSYSDLDFFQNLTQVTGQFQGKRGETADGYDQTELSIDISGETPNYTLPADVFNPRNINLNAVSRRLINTKGYNYASKIDVEYYLSKAAKITSGARYSITDFEARETLSSKTTAFDAYGATLTDDQKTGFQNLLTHTAGAGFNGGTVAGLDNGWIYVPGYEALDMFPGFANLDGGSVFDFNVALEDVVSEDGNLIFNPAKSYGAEETSSDFYTQLDWKTALFQIPVALNFGVRAIRTGNTSEGFSSVQFKDFQDEDEALVKTLTIPDIYHEVSTSRWDVLPSFNSNFTLKENLRLRLNVSKGVSRPKFKDLIPNNTITFVTNVPAGTDLSGQTLVRGEVKSGNPDLKPYTAWMYDLTLEGYTKSRGAFIFSAFFKDIKDYIARGVVEDAAYPGEEILGFELPTNQEGLLFDISKPINITDGQIYGFEAGVTQPFTFLPGFAKGFGIKANYSYVESSFDGAVGDAANGFPGTSKHSANGTFYYEQKAFSLRFTAAYRGDYLSNLGGVGSTRADESHYTEGTTILGFTARVNMLKRKLQLTTGVSNMTGEDIRRYQGDDKTSFSAYYDRDPIWKFGLRYKF